LIEVLLDHKQKGRKHLFCKIFFILRVIFPQNEQLHIKSKERQKFILQKHELPKEEDKELELLLSQLNFDPNGPGEGGKGVQIDKEKEEERKEKFKQNQFNIMASDQISVNRTIPDYRSEKFFLIYLL
jgi:hypothetical protein